MHAILTQNTIDINTSLRKCLFSQNKRSGDLNPKQVDNFKAQVLAIIENMKANNISEIEAELKMSIALKGRAAELMLNLSKYNSFSKTDKRKEYLTNLINLHIELDNHFFQKHI